MTLVELMIAISIMTLILGTVTGLVIFVARSLAPTKANAALANDAMITSALFANDVAQASTFTTTAPTGCGSTAGTTLAWFQTPASSATVASVWYQYSGIAVTRTDCLTGARVTVADDLQTGSTPVLACLNGTTTPVACSSRGVSTGVRVTLTLSTSSAQGAVVVSSLVLTGAWMIS